MRRPAALAPSGVLLAAVTLTVTFVLLGKEPAGGPQPARLSGGEQAATPLSVGRAALWDSWDTLRLGDVRGARLRGDAVVLVGGGREKGERRLVVAEADSGKERWSVGTGTALGEENGLVVDGVSGIDGTSTDISSRTSPLLTGEGGDWSVLVSYAAPDDPERPQGERTGQGVAALSGRDGSLRWKRELPGEVTLLTSGGGSDSTALVGVRPNGAREVTSYAIDTRNEGRTRWKHKGDWVFSLAGDTALGEHRGPAEAADPEGEWKPGDPFENRGGSVFAVDARTGTKKWDLKGRHQESSIRGAVQGRAVIRTADELSYGYTAGDFDGLVVDTGTGDVSDYLRDPYDSCGATNTACSPVGAWAADSCSRSGPAGTASRWSRRPRRGGTGRCSRWTASGAAASTSCTRPGRSMRSTGWVAH